MRMSGHVTQQRMLVLLAGLGALLAILGNGPASAETASPELIARGEYLARAGDCVACHTKPRGQPFAGGVALQTPFGGIAAPNITPDTATGIGSWSDDDFYRALHEGIGKDGAYRYPAFPFPWYTKVTRNDALAIRAYLFSQRAVNAASEANTLAFPFSVRESLLAWRTLFFRAKEFEPDPAQTTEVNRGDYLVNGLGHCGECHNRRNVLGASDWSGRLQGGEIEGWYAPNLTADGHEGVGSWSIDEIATFLKTGVAPGKGVVLGPMAETIKESLSYLNDGDLRAIATYLKSVKPEAAYKPDLYVDFGSAHPAGGGTYLTYCASCHQPDGSGIAGAVPALAGNGAVMAKGPENVVGVVLGGLEAGHGYAPMPAVGAGMTDAEVADVTNYVRQAWGNEAPPTAEPGAVSELRQTTQTLLAGNLAGGCPPLGDGNVAKAIEKTGAMSQLHDATMSLASADIDSVLARIKADAPQASDDEIVNTLTAAYCPAALSQSAQPSDASPAASMGTFSTLVYGRLKTLK